METSAVTAQNARHAPKQVEAVSSPHYPHRFRFPTPLVGARYLTGVCDCGATSQGLAYERGEMESWRKHHAGRLGKRSRPV